MTARRRKVAAGVGGATLLGLAAVITSCTPILNKLVDRVLPPPASSVQTLATWK